MSEAHMEDPIPKFGTLKGGGSESSVSQTEPLPRDAIAPGAFDEALAMTAQSVADTVGQTAPTGETPIQSLRDAAFKHSMAATHALAALEAELASEREFLGAQIRALKHDNERHVGIASREATQRCEAEDALQLILPMARAYASEHPVGSNQACVMRAVNLLTERTQGGG